MSSGETSNHVAGFICHQMLCVTHHFISTTDRTEEGAAAQFETTTPLCVAMQTISRQEVVVVCSLTQSADRDAAVTHS